MLTRTTIEQYFLAQKQAGLLFLCIGILAIVLAAFAWLYYKTPVWKGAAIPLAVVGCMQVAAGYLVYTQSDELRISNVYALDMNPLQLKEKELPRMQSVQKRFTLYRPVQLLLLAAGLWLIYRNRTTGGPGYGFGITLTIQALILLTVYYFAARRACQYIAQLEALIQQL